MAVLTKNSTRTGNDVTVGYEAELWRMADALRGSMDAAEYKHVVLGLIFLKYISDAFEKQHAKLVAEKAEGAEHMKDPTAELSIHGVEKTDETGRLYRINLAVHCLEGDIRHGGQVNSYYDATGGFNFVLATPRFNVNAVDKERLKDSVGRKPPLPLRPAAHRQREINFGFSSSTHRSSPQPARPPVVAPGL